MSAGAGDRYEIDHGADGDQDWTELLGRDPAIAGPAWARTVDGADFADDDAVLQRLEAIMVSERDGIAESVIEYPERVRASRQSFVLDEDRRPRTRAVGVFVMCPVFTWIPVVGDEVGEPRQWTPWVGLVLVWSIGFVTWAAWRWWSDGRPLSALAVAAGAVGCLTSYPWAIDRLIPASRVVGSEMVVLLAKTCMILGMLLVLSALLKSDGRRRELLKLPDAAEATRRRLLLLRCEIIEEVLADPSAARASLPFRWSGPDGDGLVVVRNRAIRILEARGAISQDSAAHAVKRPLLRAGRPIDRVYDAVPTDDSRWKRRRR